MYPLIVMGAMALISGASAYLQYRNSAGQNDAQALWNQYNNSSARMAGQYNAAMQAAVGRFNAAMQMATGEASARLIEANTDINLEIIRRTSLYNDQLLAEEERKLWSAWGLDDLLYSNARGAERGTMIAAMGASGVTIGQGTMKDLVADQKTQEALDRFVMRHNANIKAADILNSRLQNGWQSNLEMKKVMWEGAVNALATRFNSAANALGTLGNAVMGSQAMSTTAELGFQSGQYSSAIQYSQNNTIAQAQLTSGLFGAVQNGIAAYYATKTPTPNVQNADASKVIVTGQSGLNTPGTSLLSSP